MATVALGKIDENGGYTDFRKCGDYHPPNTETNPDRYQLPLIETTSNDMRSAQVFSKLDLRFCYHQMAVLEADRSKTSFWGAQRILWEWWNSPIWVKEPPSIF